MSSRPNTNISKTGYKRGIWKNLNTKIPKGVLMCDSCHAIYYKKAWHNADKLSKGIGGSAFAFHTCPACQMVKTKVYEGDVIVRNVEPKFANDLAHMILAFGRRAMIHDNQDRIVTFTTNGGVYKVTTTTNELAVRIGRKIRETFKGTDVAVSYSS